MSASPAIRNSGATLRKLSARSRLALEPMQSTTVSAFRNCFPRGSLYLYSVLAYGCAGDTRHALHLAFHLVHESDAVRIAGSAGQYVIHFQNEHLTSVFREM